LKLIPPATELGSNIILVFSLTPFPLKLFSFIEKVKVEPDDPTPAPAEISPVGFSSTVMFISF